MSMCANFFFRELELYQTLLDISRTGKKYPTEDSFHYSAATQVQLQTRASWRKFCLKVLIETNILFPITLLNVAEKSSAKVTILHRYLLHWFDVWKCNQMHWNNKTISQTYKGKTVGCGIERNCNGLRHTGGKPQNSGCSCWLAINILLY